jgi:hypothetical protein
MPQAVAVPLGAAGIGALGSLFSSKQSKSGGVAPQAQDTTAAQTGITDLARMLQGQAGGIYNVGLPAYQRATGFYNNLLGSRTAQTQSLAPALENNAASAAGTQNAIRAQTQRGPTQDLALAQAKMQQQGQNANMYRDAPFAAANALGTLGMQGLGQAGQNAGTALGGYSSLFGNLNNANQNAQQQQYYNNQQSQQFGMGLGNLFTTIMSGLGGGKKPVNNTVWGSGLPSAAPPTKTWA